MTAAPRIALLLAGAYTGAITLRETERAPLISVAVRTHNHQAMAAFYAEAFGARFREVQTGTIASLFGEIGGGITLKLVPIREAADFTGFPEHQLGFEVPDVDAIANLALKHGGRMLDAPRRVDGRMHASIRDPDGNTIELYGTR